MKSALLKVGMTGLGALVLSFCGGCIESRAETEVPVEKSVPSPESIEAPTVVTAPSIPPMDAVEEEDDLPAVPAKVAVIAQTNTVSTNALKLVQEVTPPESMKTSPAVQDIVKLAQAGVGDDVMLSYVTNSTRKFSLTSDEILYLNDLGVSPEVITALVQRSGSAPTVAAPAEMAQPAAPTIANAPITNVYPGQAGLNNNGLPAGAEYPVNQVEAPLTPPANYVEQPTSTSFYSSLAPYGNWVDVPDYGMCWQPAVTVVNTGWRPYSDRGRWLWTDCGWYWQSDYSWGWAPFHYGRWCTYPRLGWIWVPGTEWGPSWVSWRSTSSYCGWAPLPPFFGISFGFTLGFGSHHRRDWDRPHSWTFVDHHHFTDRNPGRWAVARGDAVVIHKTSLVQDHFSYDRHQRPVNTGFGKRPIEKAIGADVRTLAIHETTAVPMGGRADRLVDNGSAIVAVKPPMQRHAAMGNSLQATRAAAFASAPVARASDPLVVTKNTAGTGTAPSTFSRSSSGGSIKQTTLAKADVPEVPRIPASRAPQTQSRSFSTPSSLPLGSVAAPTATRDTSVNAPIVNGSQSRGRQGSPRPSPMQSTSAGVTKQTPGAAAVNNSVSTPPPVRSQANPFSSSMARNQGGGSGLSDVRAPSPNSSLRNQSSLSGNTRTPVSSPEPRTAPLVPGGNRSFARTDSTMMDAGRSAASRPQFSGNRAAASPPAMSTAHPFSPIPSGVGSTVRSTPAPVSRPEPARSFSAPSAQYSAPVRTAPSYSAPVHSAPSYSAPAHSAPAPSYSAPSHSAPAAASSSHSSSSSSSGGGGGGRGRDK